jgi:hypothetical protein
MADQDKDRTNPAGQKASPGISSSGLSSNTQQRTSAAGSSGGQGDSGTSASMGGGSANDLKDAGRRTVDEAKQYTKDMAGHAKEQGQSMLEQQKDSAVGKVDSAAHAFRNTAEQLQGEGQSQASRYVSMFAEQLESLSGQLRQKNMDTLIRDAEDLGRRSPGVFLAGSVVAGFVLARFLKSSAEHRHQSMDMSHNDQRSHSPYTGDTSGAMADAYGSTGSDVRSAGLGGQPSMTGSGGNTAASSSSAGMTGVSGTGITGSATGGGSIGNATSTTGAGVTGTGDKVTPSPTSSASKPGGNSYDNR